MTKKQFQHTLKLRLAWYQKAMEMKSRKIPWENGFDWPDGAMPTWGGAVKELKNTLDMLERVK